MMRVLRMALGPVAVLLVACGGTVNVTSGGPGGSSGTGGAAGSGGGSGGSSGRGDAGGSDSGTGSETGSDSSADGASTGPIVGQLLLTTEAFGGQLLETFTADLQPLPPPATSFSCPGATAIVGDCCLFPPIRPPPTPLPGSGTGTANYGSNAGVLALLDATSSATIGTFDFGSRGYAGLPANYYATRWNPGDILTVSATGDGIAAFTVSVPALSPPAVKFPSSIVLGKDMKVTWQPDPNADTVMVSILDDDAGSVEIACSAPDSDGAVTVDASLLAAFEPGDFCQESADRGTVRYAGTPMGRVALKSFGMSASSDATVR